MQSSLTAANLNISNNANAITVANTRISVLDANLGVTTINISNLQSNSIAHATTLSDLQANAAAQSLSLAVLTVNAASQSDALGVLTANTIAQQIAIAALQSNASVQAAELIAYAANSAVQGNEINLINANLLLISSDVAELQGNVTVLQNNLAPVGELQANDAVQATQIKTLDANLGTATTNIGINETEINALRANITATNAAIVTANLGMKSYVDSVTSNWTANAITQQVQIAVLDANLGTVTTNITTLFGNAATQTNLITTLNANVNAANVEIGSLRANVNAANAVVATYILTNNANVNAANVEIGSLRANVNAANVEIGSLRANINAANLLLAPISNLSAIIGDIIPITSNTYSVGKEGVKWYEIWAGGNINTTSYLQAGVDVQSPLVSTGNLNANTALIYEQAIVGNIRTVDQFGLANLGNIITSSGIFWANGTNYSQSFTAAGNITFADTTIGTADGTSSGIILNSAGAGEIAMLDYVGINNTNPGYWLHIGDGSPGTGDNTGNISIDFRNNTGTQRGSTILGYAWWDSASTGTDNRGTGPHTHFGIYKNDDTFDNKFIEWDYTSGNANVGNLTATSITVLTNVAYTMANYQNWTSNVSTIGAALDQLAQRLKDAGF